MDELQVYKLLGFNQVLDDVACYAKTSLGKQAILKTTYERDKTKVEYLLDLTTEGYKIIVYNDNLVLSGKIDLSEYLAYVLKSGYLQAQDFLDIINHIEVVNAIIVYHKNLELDDISYFQGFVNDLVPLNELQAEIERCIDNTGKIKNNASFEIRKLRKSITSKQNEVKNTLNKLLNQKNNMLTENIITLRNNRQVLAVKQEFKHIFGGIIHDESITGQTIYIEPSEIVALNNQISELETKLNNEIIKILIYLSNFIRNHASDISNNLAIITKIDVMLAKARYALNNDGVRLAASDDEVVLNNVAHPLISASQVVRNDIVINSWQSALVITGANAGGKTITLKTVGICAMMNQSGIFCFAKFGSKLPIFSQIFAVIGDNQLLEQNLSTFSAHIYDLKNIIANVDKNSLVLLDELGNGTNPSEGSALAIAVIEELHSYGCKLIATTHYDELKEYALNNEYILCGSVVFDKVNLKPTYKLKLNSSGLSYGLHISQKLGLKQSIIDNAKVILKQNSNNTLGLLEKLEQEKLLIDEQKVALHAMETKLKQELSSLEIQANKIKDDEETIIQNAKLEANKIVDEALMRADETFSKLAKHTKHHQLLEEKRLLEQQKHTIEIINQNKRVELMVGDHVTILPFESKGIIKRKINANSYEVLIGNVLTVVKKDKILFDQKGHKQQPKRVTTTLNVSRRKSTRLDLRGKRVSEASYELEQFLDELVLIKFNTAIIVHGFGTGAIRKLVIKELDKREVKYRSGNEGEGGLGVTVIEEI